jgi:hypothetical protein
VPDTPASLPDFTRWPSFPFEGDIRVKKLDEPVAVEPPRKGEDPADCTACAAPDDAYIWVSDRWRVRAMDRPTGLPMVLILESRSHLDLGDLPNMLAAELGVMTVRLERAIRSLDEVARVHVNRWGDGEAHLHLWFMGRPQGRLQLRGTFLSLWDEILPAVSEAKWRENLALVAAWLAEFGGTPLAEPPRIDWKAPAKLDPAIATLTLSDEPDESDRPVIVTPAEASSEPAGAAETPSNPAGAAGPSNPAEASSKPAGAASKPAPGAVEAREHDAAGKPERGSAADARSPEPAGETVSVAAEPALERVPRPVPDASAGSRS